MQRTAIQNTMYCSCLLLGTLLACGSAVCQAKLLVQKMHTVSYGQGESPFYFTATIEIEISGFHVISGEISRFQDQF